MKQHVTGMGFMFACCVLLSACASSPADKATAEPSPAATKPVPAAEKSAEQGWVWMGGDGEHPSAVLAVKERDGRLVLSVLSTPAENPGDFAHGAVVPFIDYEATDRRVVFQLKRVMPSIAPVSTILEFDQPPSGDEVTGYLSIDPADAHKIGLTAEDVTSRKTTLRFTRRPWPIARTWAEVTGTPPTPSPDAPRLWSGACMEDHRLNSGYVERPGTTVEMTTQGKALLSCRVVERVDGHEHVLLELQEISGTYESGNGVVLSDGVRHSYHVLSYKQDDGQHVMISDECKPKHTHGQRPPFFSTMRYRSLPQE